MEDTLKCKNCGKSLKPDWLACPYCKQPVQAPQKKCSHCGEELEDDMVICPKCLQPVKTAQEKRCPACNAVREEGNEKCPGCGRTEKEAKAAVRAIPEKILLKTKTKMKMLKKTNYL